MIFESSVNVGVRHDRVQPMTRQATQRSTETLTVDGFLGTDKITEYDHRRVRPELAQVKHAPKPRQQKSSRTDEVRY